MRGSIMYIQGTNGITNENVTTTESTGFKKNPYMNTVFFDYHAPKKEEPKTNKEVLLERAMELPADVRDKFIAELENSTISKDFMDMLNKRYEKKKAEFEVAWAEYQQLKNHQKFLEKILTILLRKYADSESGYEQSLVRNAQNNFRNGEINTDIALSNASDIAHRLV